MSLDIWTATRVREPVCQEISAPCMCNPTQQVRSELQHCNLVCSTLESEYWPSFWHRFDCWPTQFRRFDRWPLTNCGRSCDYRVYGSDTPLASQWKKELEVVFLKFLLWIWYSLAGQTHFRQKKREGSVELCIQTVSRRTVQCGPITFQHLVTWYITSPFVNGLENGNWELGHHSYYYRSCKNTLTILPGEHVHFATGISRVHYWKSGYVI